MVIGMRAIWMPILLLALAGCSTGPSTQPPALSPEIPPFRDLPKTDIPSEASAFSHFLMANALLADGELDNAVKQMEAAVESEPNDAFLHFRLASLYVKRGDMRKALAEAETAARLDPKYVDNHMLLAGLYSSLGENQKGITEYNEALKLDPKNQEALLYLGALYLQIDDLPRATEKLEELLKVDPNSMLGHYYLGRVRAKSKLYLAAEQSYGRRHTKLPAALAGQRAKCLGAPSAR
jgi:tetratricopeptide (TPR) repeat protein